jgi:hypothetical protein
MVVTQAISVAVLTVALVHGYRLFAPVPTTAVVAVRADTIKGDMDKAGGPVGDQLTEPAPDQDEPGHKQDGGGVPNEASKSSAGASAANSGDAQIIAGRKLAVRPLRTMPISIESGGSLRTAAVILRKRSRNSMGRSGSGERARLHIRANALDEMGVFDRALADYDEQPGRIRDRLYHSVGTAHLWRCHVLRRGPQYHDVGQWIAKEGPLSGPCPRHATQGSPAGTL